MDESQSHVKMPSLSFVHGGVGDDDDSMMGKDGDDHDHDVVGGGTDDGKAHCWLLFG